MSKTFAYDFQAKEFVTKDGRLVPTEDIRVWIEKIIRSEKWRCKIYEGTDFGIRIEDLLIGSNYNRAFSESEAKREINEALLQNPRIKEIQGLQLLEDNTIEFEVVLNDDTTITGTVAF